MKKVFLSLISSFCLTAAMASTGIDLRYANNTQYTGGVSSDKTINVMAEIGDNITLEVQNAVTALGAWKFNREPVSAANVNPFTVTVTAAGVYSVNTNSVQGTVYFYVCVSNGARPLAPAPIVGSASNCAGATGPAAIYTLDGTSVLPYCVNSYTWTAPNGASVVTSNNGMTATVTFNPGFVSGNLRVRANTTAGTSKERSLFISCSDFDSRRLTAADAEETANVNVYPNPFTDKLFVTTNSSETLTISIADMTGKVIKTGEVRSNGSIDVLDFPKGFYFYTLSNGGGPIKRARIIKQ